jgi:CPA1 family monovalent cation:H+ antiporter
MRGALSLALALSLSSAFPHHSEILTLTFTVVAFTIVAQGVTIKPLIRMLKLGRIEEDEYSRARVRQIAVGSAISELDDMFSKNLMSDLVYQRLRRELGARLDEAKAAVETVYAGDREHVFGEVENAKHRLMAAEKSSIEQAFHQGLISSSTAAAMVEKADALYREFRSHTASPTGAKES